jgi:hypothetical protein
MAAPPEETVGLRSRPRLGRAGGLAATLASLALLAAAAGCSSGGNGGGTADSKRAGPPKGIQVPAKIASLKKVSDTPDEEFKDSGIAGAVRRNLHSVYYRDSTDDSRTVSVVGGLGLPVPTDGPSDKVKALFTEWNLSANGKPTISVSTGSAGSSAECATVDSTSQWCGWVNGKAALTIDFDNFAKKKAQALVPQILSAMVQS